MSKADAKNADTPDIAGRLLAGDRPAMARALTAVENDSATTPEILGSIHDHLGSARTIGITGAPGAGKSTLVNAYVAELRRRGSTVGVIAVDPSSPITGGAILGDRIRMAEHDGDTGVFVRSLSSRGHLGGLSRAAARVIDVMDAGGMDVVIVETVGTGQAEVEIADITTTKVVVLAPGLGDDVQAIKAGILEIADVFAVNKADLPDAGHTASQLSSMLRLRSPGSGWTPPIIMTTATTGDGAAELADAVDAHIAFCGDQAEHSSTGRARRLLASIAGTMARTHLARLDDAELDRIAESVSRGDLSHDEAARMALARLGPKLSDS